MRESKYSKLCQIQPLWGWNSFYVECSGGEWKPLLNAIEQHCLYIVREMNATLACYNWLRLNKVLWSQTVLSYSSEVQCIWPPGNGVFDYSSKAICYISTPYLPGVLATDCLWYWDFFFLLIDVNFRVHFHCCVPLSMCQCELCQ